MTNTLLLSYVSIYVVSALLAGTLGYWSVTRAKMRSKRWFGALLLVLALWSIVAISELVLSGRSVQRGIKILWGAIGLSVVALWVLFTAHYSHRSLRTNPVVRVFVVSYVLFLITSLTTPLHDLYYASMTLNRIPFTHVETTRGPVRLLVVGYVLGGIGVGTYYLGRLFERSRYRSRTPTIILAGSVLLGIVPFVASELGMVPVETYNHTVFGVSVFVLGVSYAVFRHSFYELAPIARNVVLDEINDPMFVLDSDFRLVDYNKAATTIAPDLSSESIGALLREIRPELAELVDEQETDRREQYTLTVDGERRHFSVLLSGITVHDSVDGYVVLLRDITERRNRERQLEAAKAELESQNERLDEFVSIVSHDLRNPLNVAQIRVDLVTQKRDDEDAEAAKGALERMDTMIDETLTLARAGRTIETTERIRLEDVVTEAWVTVQSTDAELDCRLDGAIVEGDRNRLLRVFENLFRNAIEHNDQPVVVRVGTLDTRDGFYVEDDGRGLPDGQHGNVFDYGYTGSDDGSGFGLAIVSDIVDAHGWTISAETTDDGARFEIVIEESG